MSFPRQEQPKSRDALGSPPMEATIERHADAGAD